jgi:hypothetical protein
MRGAATIVAGTTDPLGGLVTQLCSGGARNVDGVEGELVNLTVPADEGFRSGHGQDRVALLVWARRLRRRWFT